MDFPDFDAALDAVLVIDSRYERAAYEFVREVLERSQVRRQRRSTQKSAKKGAQVGAQVGAHEFLQQIRTDALEQFGPMTCAVFEEWGIRNCGDFGEIVFNLMDRRIVERGHQDRREDFQDGFDFEEAFCQPFEPSGRHEMVRVAVH